MQTMHVLIGALKTIVPVTTESVLNTKSGPLNISSVHILQDLEFTYAKFLLHVITRKTLIV
jgi:hypothetical protein